MSLSVLLLSGYDAVSHQYWRNGLSRLFPDFLWTQLALPDRHFYWRARGNALQFYHTYSGQLTKNYDLVIATSMVDLNNLVGFVPQLAAIPRVLYFHENQFYFPQQELQSQTKPPESLIHLQITSIFSALNADWLVFNSAFNRDTFLDGVERLADKLPDGMPGNLAAELSAKSEVIPVSLAEDVEQQMRARQYSALVAQQPAQGTKTNNMRRPSILWNHRWEHDRNPEVFFAALKIIREQQDFRLQLLGQQFRKQPKVFKWALEEFAEQIEHCGFVSRDTYLQILSESDWVISTTRHEFQGIAMLEAIALGCKPIAPDDLVYPEYVPESNRYPREAFEPRLKPAQNREQVIEQEATSLARVFIRELQGSGSQPPAGEGGLSAVQNWTRKQVKKQWEDCLARLISA